MTGWTGHFYTKFGRGGGGRRGTGASDLEGLPSAEGEITFHLFCSPALHAEGSPLPASRCPWRDSPLYFFLRAPIKRKEAGLLVLVVSIICPYLPSQGREDDRSRLGKWRLCLCLF